MSAIVFSFAFYRTVVKRPIFLTTHSPSGAYAVLLSGQKERPIWFTVEVFADVLKQGEPFWVDQQIHSGDAMDLSFAAGWPDYRWVDESALQFYRKKNFEEFKGVQEILVANNAKTVVRHLSLQTSMTNFLFSIWLPARQNNF